MHKIDVEKGSKDSTVSRQWAMRPDDEKFLSLGALRDQVKTWRDQSYVQPMKPADINVIYDEKNPEFLRFMLGDKALDPTHFAFGQVCAMAGVPADYARTLPGPLASINLNYGLKAIEQKNKAAYLRENGSSIMRAVTSPSYGRIFDEDIAAAVMEIAG